MNDRVALSVHGETAELRFVAADRRNAIDHAFCEELLAGVAEVAASDARALVICADGRAFSVGGDLRHLAAHDDISAELVRMIRPFHESLATLDELRIPVVAAAQGAVAGGGLGFLYVADRVLVAPDARLVHAFDKLGLAGDGGGTFHLPRLLGLARARQFWARDRGLDAAEAVEWGLATAVAEGDLVAAAHAEASRLSANDAIGELRGLLRRPPAREHLAAELEVMRRLGTSAFTADAMRSFSAR